MPCEGEDHERSTALKSGFKEHPLLEKNTMQLNSVQINMGCKVEQIME